MTQLTRFNAQFDLPRVRPDAPNRAGEDISALGYGAREGQLLLVRLDGGGDLQGGEHRRPRTAPTVALAFPPASYGDERTRKVRLSNPDLLIPGRVFVTVVATASPIRAKLG